MIPQFGKTYRCAKFCMRPDKFYITLHNFCTISLSFSFLCSQPWVNFPQLYLEFFTIITRHQAKACELFSRNFDPLLTPWSSSNFDERGKMSWPIHPLKQIDHTLDRRSRMHASHVYKYKTPKLNFGYAQFIYSQI